MALIKDTKLIFKVINQNGLLLHDTVVRNYYDVVITYQSNIKWRNVCFKGYLIITCLYHSILWSHRILELGELQFSYLKISGFHNTNDQLVW